GLADLEPWSGANRDVAECLVRDALDRLARCFLIKEWGIVRAHRVGRNASQEASVRSVVIEKQILRPQKRGVMDGSRFGQGPPCRPPQGGGQSEFAVRIRFEGFQVRIVPGGRRW